jgi:type I restriction enzyme M protein
LITGEIKNQVDGIWTTFWTNGISNPMSVIEQISYLLFIKRLDDLELAKERKAQRLGGPVEGPRFGPHQQHLRWSRFKNLGDGAEMLKLVRDEVFPFIKTLGGDGAATSYARHMKDAVFLITSPALLTSVVDQMEKLPLEDRDTKGDLYEYMLSKLTTAGQNGQFRTPRHIIRMMVEMVSPTITDVVCDPACGTAGFLVSAAEYLRELTDEAGNLVLNARGAREHFNKGMFHGFDSNPGSTQPARELGTAGLARVPLLGTRPPDRQASGRVSCAALLRNAGVAR